MKKVFAALLAGTRAVSMMSVAALADGDYVKYNDVKEELGAIPKEDLDLDLKFAFCG